MYNKLKKQNGEKFAQALRNYHSGILEIPDIDVIVRHAGRGAADAQALGPYLLGLICANDNTVTAGTLDPFVLLDRAGYEAFYADTLEKQNKIKPLFAPGEELCTFGDSTRHERYHIVHAIKKDVAKIEREDFNGNERRQDAYGTSVISIQMLKTGGLIKITNRYNHTVDGADNTFGSNPDEIIPGLSNALKDQFDVDFSANTSELPEGFHVAGKRIFKHNEEDNNVYYGDQAWTQDGVVHEVDKAAGDALFGKYLFDKKTRKLKKVDPDSKDSFVDDFNRCYDGDKLLHVRQGNLYLGDTLLIGAEQSRIKTLHLPGMTELSDNSLHCLPYLEQINAPSLVTAGDHCLSDAKALTRCDLPLLTSVGNGFLWFVNALESCDLPSLTSVGNGFLCFVKALTRCNLPLLTSVGDEFLTSAKALESCDLPSLKEAGNSFLRFATALESCDLPSLTTVGNSFLRSATALESCDLPSLVTAGDNCRPVVFYTLQEKRRALPLPHLQGQGHRTGGGVSTIRVKAQANPT